MTACLDHRERSDWKAPVNIETFLRADDSGFNQLIKNSFDMIVLLDDNGVQKYVSESCERILGFKQEALMGIPVIDAFIHPDDQAPLRRNFQNLVRGEFHGAVEYRHRHKDGTWVHLETVGTNQLNNPAIQSLVLNVRNVSKRKRAESALMASEARLRELNATKDKLFSIIAHDLRSPFNSILGLTDLLTEQNCSEDAEDLEWCLQNIHSSAKNTLGLLDNLLEWARSQTGQIRCAPQVVEAAEVIEEVMQLSRSASRLKGVNLDVDLVEEVTLYVDANMLKVVLRNLLSNAIKYTNPGGHIRVIVRRMSHTAEICVADNGVGIDAAIQETLFGQSSFYTSAGTENEAGAGLGLILCQEFVEKLGGQIWVESVLGEGSRFKFTVPLPEHLSCE